MTLQPNLPPRLWHDLINYEPHSNLGWIVNEWLSNPRIHGILQNLIQVLTWHPQLPLAKGQNHNGRKIHTTTSQVITNCYFILFTIFLVFLKGGNIFLHIPKEECLKELTMWLQKFVPPPTCFLVEWIV